MNFAYERLHVSNISKLCTELDLDVVYVSEFYNIQRKKLEHHPAIFFYLPNLTYVLTRDLLKHKTPVSKIGLLEHLLGF